MVLENCNNGGYVPCQCNAIFRFLPGSSLISDRVLMYDTFYRVVDLDLDVDLDVVVNV